MTRSFLVVPALLGALAASILARPAAVRAAEASPWVKGAQSAARLIEGPGRGAARTAGLEIRLEPHVITYWRDPGDAGVPPRISFTGSTNLRSAILRYPAPHKIEEAGAIAYGYENDVTFPILITPDDPSQSVGLAVTLDYAACHDICLPVQAVLRLKVDDEASAEAGRVQDALASVPRPATVGETGTPSVLAVTPDGSDGFTVTAGGTDRNAVLFVEGPEGWAYEAGPPAPAGDGRSLFPVKRVDHPKGIDRPPAPLILTLTTPGGAVEVPVPLDDGAPAR